jgi:hypothetical protein
MSERPQTQEKIMFRTLSLVLVALAALLGGCISTEYIGADGTKVRSTRIVLVPPVSYAPIYGVSGGYRYQPEMNVYDVRPQPTLVRKYGPNGLERMFYVCPGGRQPVAGKC